MGPAAHKILFVDDNDQLVELMGRFLRKAGFTVLSAANGAEGLRVAQSECPDIVVSDIGMPVMNGVEMLQRLRASPATSAIPVILMTGRPDQVTLRDGMQLGADDYLPKPLRAAELLAAITTRLRRRDQYRQIANSDVRLNLTATLPHELLTPLTGIIGSADLLLMDHTCMKAAELEEVFSGIRQSGYRLLRLIHNYLLLNELDSISSREPEKRRFCDGLTPSATDVIEAAGRRRAENWSRKNDLQLNLSEATLAVKAELVAKVVEETVDNAFKFSESGRNVVISSRIENGSYLLKVSDSGRGMSPQEIAAVGLIASLIALLTSSRASGSVLNYLVESWSARAGLSPSKVARVMGPSCRPDGPSLLIFPPAMSAAASFRELKHFVSPAPGRSMKSKSPLSTLQRQLDLR